MKTEKIIQKERSKAINIVAGQPESLRITQDVKSTVRIYQNGYIGVEGRLGEADFEEMTQAATKKLARKIPYVETHDEGKQLHIDTTKDILPEKEFIPTISRLLKRLTEENPDFLFSNKVYMTRAENTYADSDGADFAYIGNNLCFSLVIKYKGSANIFDEGFMVNSDYYDEDEICRDIKMKCDAFLRQLPHVDGEEVTVIGDLEPISYMLSELRADLYYSDASLFKEKHGEKIFDEKFSMLIDRTPGKSTLCPFFDREGVVNPDYKSYIIRNGVLEGFFTTKKTAAQYNTKNLGSADGEYDSVPSNGHAGIAIEHTAESLGELVKGKAVYLSVCSGGDMTPSGDISLPTIVAYLYEDGKLLGRLPEFTVTANLSDILGKNFIGFCDKGLFSFGKNKYLVYKARLVNKK